MGRSDRSSPSPKGPASRDGRQGRGRGGSSRQAARPPPSQLPGACLASVACKRGHGAVEAGPSLGLSQLPPPARGLVLPCAGPLNGHIVLPLTHWVSLSLSALLFQMIHFLPVFSHFLFPAPEKVLGLAWRQTRGQAAAGRRS